MEEHCLGDLLMSHSHVFTIIPELISINP